MKLDLDAWAEIYVAALYALALNDFGLFRQLIHPDMLWNWWLDEVARELTKFYRDLIAGRRPILALAAPPQHGKSWTLWDFMAWFAGGANGRTLRRSPTPAALSGARRNNELAVEKSVDRWRRWSLPLWLGKAIGASGRAVICRT